MKKKKKKKKANLNTTLTVHNKDGQSVMYIFRHSKEKRKLVGTCAGFNIAIPPAMIRETFKCSICLLCQFLITLTS